MSTYKIERPSSVHIKTVGEVQNTDYITFSWDDWVGMIVEPIEHRYSPVYMRPRGKNSIVGEYSSKRRCVEGLHKQLGNTVSVYMHDTYKEMLEWLLKKEEEK